MYVCDCCKFQTTNKYSFNRHKLTKKHLLKQNALSVLNSIKEANVHLNDAVRSDIFNALSNKTSLNVTITNDVTRNITTDYNIFCCSDLIINPEENDEHKRFLDQINDFTQKIILKDFKYPDGNVDIFHVFNVRIHEDYIILLDEKTVRTIMIFDPNSLDIFFTYVINSE